MVGSHQLIMGTDSQFSNSDWGKRTVDHYKEVVDWWRGLRETGKKYGIEFSQEEVDMMTGLNIGRLIKVVDMPQFNKRKYGWSILTPPPRLSP